MDWLNLVTSALEPYAASAITMLAPVLLGALVGLVARALTRLNIQIGADRQTQYVQWAMLAIQYAAEARAEREKAIAAGAGLPPYSGYQLLSLAVDYFIRNTGASRAFAVDLIHGLLPASTEGAAASVRATEATAEAEDAVMDALLDGILDGDEDRPTELVE